MSWHWASASSWEPVTLWTKVGNCPKFDILWVTSVMWVLKYKLNHFFFLPSQKELYFERNPFVLIRSRRLLDKIPTFRSAWDVKRAIWCHIRWIVMDISPARVCPLTLLRPGPSVRREPCDLRSAGEYQLSSRSHWHCGIRKWPGG